MRKLSILLLLLVLYGCKKNNPSPPTEPRGTLLSFQKAGTLTPAELNALNTEHNMSSLVQYTVDFYSVTYSSIYQGSPITLSGLVVVPRVSDSLSLLQYTHGTLIPDKVIKNGILNAPSEFNGTIPSNNKTYYEVRLFCCVAAAHGYIVSAPDYAGLGVSAFVDHPYTINHELAESSVDMLRATKQFIQKQNLLWSSRIFLTGWSEGGGACFATHKAIQTEYPTEFNLVASAPYAGPYDDNIFMGLIFDNPNTSYEYLSVYNWAIKTRNDFFLGSRPWDQIWRYPVKNPMDAILVPSTRPVDILQPFFLDMLQNGTDVQLVNALDSNSIDSGWVPMKPVFFYVGLSDELVPHQITLNTYQEYKLQGAPVTLYTYPGNHFTAVFDYFFQMISNVDSLNRF